MFVSEIAIADTGGRSEASERSLLVPPSQIIRRKKKLAVDDGRDDTNGNEFVILRVRQAAKQDAVHQAEHRRGRSNAQCQREYGHRREPGALAQLPQRVANVLK